MPIPSTEPPTETPVWFPPTATPTPLPSPTLPVTPTLDARPRFGALLLNDSFDNPSSWTLERNAFGSIALGKNELTLAISAPEGYLYSLRRDTHVADFYLEITASPSICRGEDEYGLLLRVTPENNFYRFILTCDGQTRFERVQRNRPAVLQPLTPSGAAPPGAPSQSRLAVLAKGRDMVFYISGELQFTVHDPTIAAGTVGVFARAKGGEAVTVNFSDLAVYKALP